MSDKKTKSAAENARLIMCAGKEKMNFSLAKAVATRKRRSTDTVISHYQCKYCHQWHVGSSIIPVSESRS